MPYIIPNNTTDTYYVTIMPTKTQNGYSAIRFIGEEIPDDCTDGFIYYNDDDVPVSDFSDYTYFYSPNVYSVEEDEIVNPEPNNTSPYTNISTGSNITEMLIDINSRIDEITPYVESKTVYIDDTECIFEQVKEGSVSTQLKVDDTIKPCDYEISNGEIRVFFEPLESIGTVTITIQ